MPEKSNAATRILANQDNKASAALSFMPVILGQLDADARDMLVTVLQQTLEAGYSNGYADGHKWGWKEAEDHAAANNK